MPDTQHPGTCGACGVALNLSLEHPNAESKTVYMIDSAHLREPPILFDIIGVSLRMPYICLRDRCRIMVRQMLARYFNYYCEACQKQLSVSEVGKGWNGCDVTVEYNRCGDCIDRTTVSDEQSTQEPDSARSGILISPSIYDWIIYWALSDLMNLFMSKLGRAPVYVKLTDVALGRSSSFTCGDIQEPGLTQ